MAHHIDPESCGRRQCVIVTNDAGGLLCRLQVIDTATSSRRTFPPVQPSWYTLCLILAWERQEPEDVVLFGTDICAVSQRRVREVVSKSNRDSGPISEIQRHKQGTLLTGLCAEVG